MVKKTALLQSQSLSLMTAPCMRCKWLRSRLFKVRKLLMRLYAKELIEQLLEKKYSDIVSELAKLPSETQKVGQECIK